MDSKKRFPASEKRIWQSTARFWSAIPLFSSLLNLPDPYKKAPAEKPVLFVFIRRRKQEQKALPPAICFLFTLFVQISPLRLLL